MTSKALLLSAVTLACVATFPHVALADRKKPHPHSASQTAPLDGGLSLLIAAGVGYASKKAYAKRKKEKERSTAGE